MQYRCDGCRWPVNYATANSGRNHYRDDDDAVWVYCDDCADAHGTLGPERAAVREGERISRAISRSWDVGTGIGRRTWA